MLDPIYAQKLHYLLINRNIEEIKREVSSMTPETLERVVNLVQSDGLTITDEVERLDNDDFKKEVIDILNIQPNFDLKGGRRRRRTRSRSRKTRRTRRTRRRRYSKK
jgi:trehalose/maltose hydrolase-like predicted phosphorylase